MTQAIAIQMSREEAQVLVKEIRADVHSLGEKILRLKDGRGWKALGYASWRECVAAEFKQSQSQLYRLLHAVEVNQALQSADSSLPQLPERHVRELNKLASTQDKVEAFKDACALARTQGKDSPSARDIAVVVQKKVFTREVLSTPYAVIGTMVLQGEITPLVGKQMTDALSKILPRANVGKVMELIARYGLSCPGLIAPLAEMFKREGTGQASLVLPEMLTGFIGGVALRSASLSDLERAQEEARLQHIADAQERERARLIAEGKLVPEAVAVTIWRHEPMKTFKVLRRELSTRDLIMLQDILQQGL